MWMLLSPSSWAYISVQSIEKPVETVPLSLWKVTVALLVMHETGVGMVEPLAWRTIWPLLTMVMWSYFFSVLNLVKLNWIFAPIGTSISWLSSMLSRYPLPLLGTEIFCFNRLLRQKIGRCVGGHRLFVQLAPLGWPSWREKLNLSNSVSFKYIYLGWG